MFVFQEIPEIQVVERIQVSQTTLNTSSTSTSSGVPIATHAATTLATTVDDPFPPIPDDEKMLGYQADLPSCAHTQDEEGGSCTVREADCCSSRACASRSLSQQARVAEIG